MWDILRGSGSHSFFYCRIRFDIQTESNSADETNFLSFLCLFVSLEWDIIYLNESASCHFKTITIIPGLRCTESLNPWPPAQLQFCRLNPLERRNSLAFCCIFEHKCRFKLSNLYFLACFHLTTHSSSSCLVWFAAETVSRSKIWLYHQISIAALTCSIAWYWFLKLVQETWNWSLQWISQPQCFYLSRKHSCTAQPCQSGLSVGFSALLCYARPSEASEIVGGFCKIAICVLLWCFFIY